MPSKSAMHLVGMGVSGFVGFALGWIIGFPLADRLHQAYEPIVLGLCAVLTFVAQLLYARLTKIAANPSTFGGAALGFALCVIAISRAGELPPKDEHASWALLLSLIPAGALIAWCASMFAGLRASRG
jgi:hypothetical protein